MGLDQRMSLFLSHSEVAGVLTSNRLCPGNVPILASLQLRGTNKNSRNKAAEAETECNGSSEYEAVRLGLGQFHTIFPEDFFQKRMLFVFTG